MGFVPTGHRPIKNRHFYQAGDKVYYISFTGIKLILKINKLRKNYLELINYEISYKHYVLFFVCISFMVAGKVANGCH
jgi:hypothetical protein